MSFQSRIEHAAARRDAERRSAMSLHALALVVAAATIAATLLRVWDIGGRALWLDEAYSGWFSSLSWPALWLETPRYEPHPPLYYSLLKLWRLLAGDEAGALRGLSALAGIATVPVMALAARDLARLAPVPRPLLLIIIAAALASLSPRLVVIGQDARPYALLALAYTIAIWGWLRLTLGFRTPHAAGRWRDWAILGTGTAAVLWLHGVGLLYAGGLLAALLLSAAPGAERARWTRLAITIAAVCAVYAPCLAILAGRSGDWSNGWLSWDPARFAGAMLELFGLHHFEEMATPTIALALFPALLFLAIRALLRTGNDRLAWGMALLVLTPPLAAALISQAGTPLFLPRTLVAVLIPAYLLTAYILVTLPKRQAIVAGGFAAALIAVNLAQAMARPDLEPWRAVAAVLKREMRRGDVIWVYPNDVALPLARALGDDRAINPVPARYPALDVAGTHPSGSPAVVAIDGADARAWASGNAPPPGATAWLLRGGPAFFDPTGDVLAGLSRDRRHGHARKWNDLELRPLHPAITDRR